MYSLGCDCEQCGQKFTAVSHCIHPIKKLPFYCTQGDVGSESDCGVDGGVHAVAINFPILMDLVILIVGFTYVFVAVVAIIWWDLI
jgi:hypothetical protein